MGTEVQARLGTTLVNGVVSAVSQSGVQTTVTLSPSVLTNTLNQVSYAVKPPKVACLLAAHDRLWGIGAGPLLGRSIRPEVGRMRVFYTHGVNDHAAWPNPTTGVVPSVNLADKPGVSDSSTAQGVRRTRTLDEQRAQQTLQQQRDELGVQVRNERLGLQQNLYNLAAGERDVAEVRTSRAALQGQSSVAAINVQRQASLLDYYQAGKRPSDPFSNALGQGLGASLGRAAGTAIGGPVGGAAGSFLGSWLWRR